VYFVLATGGGISLRLVHVEHHKKHATELVFRTIYWGRFFGWIITTPLALLNLTILAGLPGAEILLGIFAEEASLIFVTSFKPIEANDQGIIVFLHT